MQYLYEKDAGDTKLTIKGENHKYLFKVRRVKNSTIIDVRNLKEPTLYRYQVGSIDSKKATLSLVEKITDEKRGDDFHIGWCVIDPKVIEKSITSLNELGVSKISFIYCDRSQNNFRVNFERLERILINSSMQCGRTSLMNLEIFDNIDKFRDKYSEFVVIDFCQNYIDENSDLKRVLIGPEGGFSSSEKENLKEFLKFGFKTKSILRSETATICVTSKILA